MAVEIGHAGHNLATLIEAAWANAGSTDYPISVSFYSTI